MKQKQDILPEFSMFNTKTPIITPQPHHARPHQLGFYKGEFRKISNREKLVQNPLPKITRHAKEPIFSFYDPKSQRFNRQDSSYNSSSMPTKTHT